MKNTKIEWTDHTFNPWSGCTKVSPGCANCYAEALSDRFSTLGQWGKGAPRVRTSENYWRQPLQWNKEAERKRVADLHSWPAGKPMPRNAPRVFCASLADWLDEEVPIEWLADLLDLIRRTPNLDWLLLTKRPENWEKRIRAVLDMKEMTCSPETWGRIYSWLVSGEAWPNIWIGTTVEDQKRADERIPQLLSIPAKVRFLSCEPLLEKVNLGDYRHSSQGQWKMDGFHWVISGGESGPHARPMDPKWARSLRDQCKAANVSFFMKQMGGTKDKLGDLEDLPEDLRIREFPNE